MAKNIMPMPSSGSILPKLIAAAVMLAVLAVVVKHPSDAATWVRALAAAGANVVDGLATFIHQIAA